jgi:hypothetical protein
VVTYIIYREIMHNLGIRHCNIGKTNSLKQNGNENIWCHQNMNRKKCMYFDNDLSTTKCMWQFSTGTWKEIEVVSLHTPFAQVQLYMLLLKIVVLFYVEEIEIVFILYVCVLFNSYLSIVFFLFYNSIRLTFISSLLEKKR